jgi:hypothetical protein
LNAHELQGNVRHGCDNPGDCHGERQPSIAEAAADKMGGRNVVVFLADGPEPREYQEKNRVDHNGVRHGKKGDGAGTERQGGHRNERIGGIEIAPDEEPGNNRAETSSAEAPLV